MFKNCALIGFGLALFCLATPVAALENQAKLGLKTYQQQCSFCHQPKSPWVLPDVKAWTHLLYTSACPEVSLKLSETERRLIKTYLEQTFKEKSQKTSDQSSDRPDEK